MKILMISSYLPYPLYSGGQVRLYNLIKELSDKHDITLICEKRLNQTEDDVKELEKICKKVITVDRRKQWTVKNIAKSAFSSQSFLITGHTHKKMQRLIIEELEKVKFDLIHVETFYVMQNLPNYLFNPPLSQPLSGFAGGLTHPRNARTRSVPVVLVDHNIEYKVYQRFLNRAPIAMRPLLSLDIAKIKKAEKNSWQQATKVVAVSQDDARVMEKNGVDQTVVSNGVNTVQFEFKPKEKDDIKKILFIGDFRWVQNQDSARFIIEEIWPELNSKFRDKNPDSNIKLWIVARKIPESLKHLTNDPSILFDEDISGMSADKIFQEADILLSPIRVGGGTSYKILEAMSCGTPVVTMPLSADAIKAKDKEHVMVGRTAYELAEKTIELLENEKLYNKIAKNGRTLIEDNYSWKKISHDLEEVYKSLTSPK